MINPDTLTTVFIGLFVAHGVGDHWLQRTNEALGKSEATWGGRLLCAKHVMTLVVAKILTLTALFLIVDVHVYTPAVAAGLAVDAVSHYVADRRTPLKKLAGWSGKGEFWELGDGKAAPAGTGAYALDQSWHLGWLLVAALICCLGA